MSSNKKIAEFPDVEAKLQKPSKQSAFERQKAEAEAKRRREAEETAAVYEDFVKSFDHEADDDEDNGIFSRGSRQPPSRLGPGAPERPPLGGHAPFSGGTSKRHFGVPAGTPLKSGPGSLGPAPASYGKKRPHDNFQSSNQRDADDGRGRLGFDDREPGALPLSKAFVTSDDEDDISMQKSGRAEEKAISRPTLRLANLPPGTSLAFVKALIPDNLTVEDIKFVSASTSGSTERNYTAAIVTLSKETPATEIDAAVSALQNRYLGFGFFLSLHRHLSSAAIASNMLTVSNSTAVSHPFGAKRVEEPIAGVGPQPIGYGRGYAPPTSYGPPAGGPLGRGSILHVPVRPPRDIKKLRMIHRVVESVLEHGPNFEALLMSRPDVQRDEKWAWIWDARSEGGIWYRWRLWEIVTGCRSKLKYIPLFEDNPAWKAPAPLPYEYTTNVDQFISDSEYNSSDDEDFEDEQARQPETGAGATEQEDTFLNPIEKSKLTHLLARLPTTLSKIRKGDIARVTTFAITHASRGADEIVDLIISNIEHPFAYTSANPDYKQETKEKERQDENSRNTSQTPDDKPNDTTDTSAARLLGLYVVSDILSSSSTSGIRHAWRYRQLFETALRTRKTFEVLGSMADKLNWGRLRADKWKRSVGLVLNLWEGWCVFPLETHALFVSSFENPPVSPKESNDGEETAKKGAGRWKTVEAATVSGTSTSEKASTGLLPVSEQEANQPGDIYDETMLEAGGTDGEIRSPRMQYSSGLDELFSDDDLDGEPDEDFIALLGLPSHGGDVEMGGTEAVAKDSATVPQIKSIGGFQMSAAKIAPKKRMRAVDMFAGSDSEREM